MLWKGSQIPQELGGRRRSHDKKGNQEIGGFRFTNILELFSIYFFFLITLLYHFFLYFFYPRHLPTPTPTTSTHYPRPTTFSYTRVGTVGFRVPSLPIFLILGTTQNLKQLPNGSRSKETVNNKTKIQSELFLYLFFSKNGFFGLIL